MLWLPVRKWVDDCILSNGVVDTLSWCITYYLLIGIFDSLVQHGVLVWTWKESSREDLRRSKLLWDGGSVALLAQLFQPIRLLYLSANQVAVCFSQSGCCMFPQTTACSTAFVLRRWLLIMLFKLGGIPHNTQEKGSLWPLPTLVPGFSH